LPGGGDKYKVSAKIGALNSVLLKMLESNCGADFETAESSFNLLMGNTYLKSKIAKISGVPKLGEEEEQMMPYDATAAKTSKIYYFINFGKVSPTFCDANLGKGVVGPETTACQAKVQNGEPCTCMMVQQNGQPSSDAQLDMMFKDYMAVIGAKMQAEPKNIDLHAVTEQDLSDPSWPPTGKYLFSAIVRYNTASEKEYGGKEAGCTFDTSATVNEFFQSDPRTKWVTSHSDAFLVGSEADLRQLTLEPDKDLSEEEIQELKKDLAKQLDRTCTSSVKAEKTKIVSPKREPGGRRALSTKKELKVTVDGASCKKLSTKTKVKSDKGSKTCPSPPPPPPPSTEDESSATKAGGMMLNTIMLVAMLAGLVLNM